MFCLHSGILPGAHGPVLIWRMAQRNGPTGGPAGAATQSAVIDPVHLNKVPSQTLVPISITVACSGVRNPARPAPVCSWGSKIGAAMWTWTSILALSASAVFLPAIVVIGLFRLAALKRPDDLKAPRQVDEWASSNELQTPK